MKDLTGVLKEGGKVADNLVTTSEERQAQVSDRHKVDMMSDSWLSKNVRPIAFLSSLVALFIVLIAEVVLMFKGMEGMSEIIFSTVVGLSGTYGSFYFYRRSSEKIAHKNAEANLEMERLRTKHEQKMERRKFRREK